MIRVAYALTLLTGAAGLIYQVAWQRYLTRILGSDSLATATVLGVFLGGLSLGYVLFGRLTLRSGRLLVVYGVVEGAIGLWGLLFPWTFAAVDALTGGWALGTRSALVFQGALVSIALIGLPTVCMGGTVPMLTRGLTQSIDAATRVHSRIYALNTAGAFLGTLAAGFVLIRTLGLPGTVRTAAVLNLIAGVFFWRMGLRTGEARAGARQRVSNKFDIAVGAPPSWVLNAIVFASGFYFMTVESSIIRITHLSIGSSSYGFALVVGAFLLAIAVGAWLTGRRRSLGPDALVKNQIAVAIGLAFVFMTLDDWPYVAHLIRLQFEASSADFFWYHAAVLGLLVGVLVIPAGFMGATLPLAFDAYGKNLERIGRTAGTLFAWNAAGNLLGGLLGGFAIYRILDNGEVFLLAPVLAALCAGLAAIHSGRRLRVAAALACVGTVVFAGLLPSHDPLRFAVGTFRLRAPLEYSFDGPEDFYRGFHEGRTVLAYRDDPEGSFAVVENPRLIDALRKRFPSLNRTITSGPSSLDENAPRPRSIVINGKADSSAHYDRETLKLAAHVPALFAGKRDRILVIGLGTGVTAGELTSYPDVRSLEVAELSPGVVELLPYFDAWTRGLRDDPRLEIVIGDAFRVIRRSRQKWDVIISEPSNPWVTGVDQLFSRDFHRLVREHLEHDGIFLHWIQRYSTNERINAIAVNTLRAEFPHLRVFRAGSDDLLVASMEPLTADHDAWAETLIQQNPEIRESLQALGIGGMRDVLAREHPEVVTDSEAWIELGLETLDRPRIHYMAGLAFFRGDDPDSRPLAESPR